MLIEEETFVEGEEPVDEEHVEEDDGIEPYSIWADRDLACEYTNTAAAWLKRKVLSRIAATTR
jgi:hypothetical protein